MIEKNSEGSQKNKISNGLIIKKEHLRSTIFPEEVQNEIIDSPYYLLIFISREDVIKIFCFPTQNKMIKKILIKLEEFSPEVVKGISEVLNDLQLNKDILHTTGICYELEKCFYETYLVGETLAEGDITVSMINKKFMAIPRVNRVSIEDIPMINE
ncbi:MAG: hypothetical protein EU516_00060 [Promethearchaeota archaeon]|nr:MAG: hypothetical protein EU516_00060 [Candidatus Lokiarchaeota archaeon]